jgi:serine/threonine protein kinase/Tfp pilus assembly protein PilF
MIGQTFLHYQILVKLGEGGMGIVYLAEDTKLDRKVAIKFLPSHISSNSDERKRFEIEAKAAAALNHPNIATIYAIEEFDDEMFIVMEYIDGVELKEKLKSGPLDTNQAINIAQQIARGLEAAHEKNIIHRDIKSTNIMITDKGQVKIMDFGLAKVRGGIELTKEQSTIGTAAYMSPEQARGDKVDQRSDLWSFGVVFYEILTGQLPFKGDYDQAVIYSIINENYQSISNFRSDISQQIEEIISKALRKNPQDRYQSAQQIIDDFHAIANPSATSTAPGRDSAQISSLGKRSPIFYYMLAAAGLLLIVIFSYLFFGNESGKINTLAVLPFVNASEDTDTEYLSDGITISLINRLAEFPDLKVMSRHSVARFKDGSEDPLAAGKLMSVKSVLAGQLDLRGDKLIVDVELLKVDDGQQLWGDRFEREQNDILKIEHDIVKRISDKLKVKLAGDKQTNHEDDVSLDPMAYDNYLRGRYIMLGTSDDGPARAQEYFRQAIEREPRLAIAHAGLGESYVNQAWLNSRNRDEIVPLAKAALKKAIDLDAGLSEAYVLAGEIAMYFDWDWSAAEAGYRRAIELNPGSDLAHREYSNFLLVMDHPEKAIAEARIAQSLDPLSVYATHQLGWSLLATGRLSEAVVEFRKAVDLNPTWVWGNIKMGMAYALMGDQKKANLAMLRADELLAGKQPSPLAQDWLAQIAFLCGDTDRTNETITRLQNQAELTYVDPFALADIFYRVGDFDKMFEYLEQGFKERSPLMIVLLLQGRSNWKKIKDDPRYLSLLKHLDFPNAQL